MKLRKIKSILSKSKDIKNNINEKKYYGKGFVTRRKYKDYDEYLSHQSEKLDKNYQTIELSDRDYEEITYNRFKSIKEIKGSSILCLGARLGGEVRAFKRLGALAIGTDINPGKKNEDVLYGDIHEIKFPNRSFDYAFTNILDHIYDVKKFSKEVSRILKDKGVLIMECANVELRESSYEVIDTTDLKTILDLFKDEFKIVSEEKIINKTQYINWEGILFHLERK